ncbi:hypothetical protein D5F01_LYC11246 [Larimichthys crocea]|uniref:LINE-1 type transposase domain-containing protein 1 n=1 Tax=Larimichthys crocea TaxID=215358 RepID=A0A6G0IE05_LARCR|nr:hypothetical protein D5F01_LYC11246 [Larimichthys crocea]
MNKNAEQDTEKESDTDDGGTQNGAPGAEADSDSLTLDSIRTIMGEVMCTGRSALKAEVKEELVGLHSNVRTDMKQQMGELASEINQKLQEVSGEMSEVEDRVTDIERFDVGVKDALTPEGPSVANMVENLIKTELGEKLGLNQGDNLGIERAHRSLAQQPAAGRPPHSVVVRFLQYTVKEKVLNAAWEEREIYIQNSRVYFDHDYAEEVLRKRKEYIPIKRKLKEKNIRFQTPLTRLRVHFSSGTVTYHSAAKAAEDLSSRGFIFDERFPRNETAGITEDTLHTLMPWRTAGPNRRDAKKKTAGTKFGRNSAHFAETNRLTRERISD